MEKKAVSRYISTKEACSYTSLGRATLIKIAIEAHAHKKIGRRVLIDREALDDYLSSRESIEV